MTEFEAVYQKLSGLGRNCLVTYYQGAFQDLDGYFAKKQVNRETIKSSSCEWRVVYWEVLQNASSTLERPFSNNVGRVIQ